MMRSMLPITHMEQGYQVGMATGWFAQGHIILERLIACQFYATIS